MSNVTLRIARVSDAHELLALYVPLSLIHI